MSEGGYYTLLSNELTADDAESKCNYYGKHLASAHSESQMNLLLDTCECEYCWIGLGGRVNPQIFEWRDRTTVDTSLINDATHWCESQPLNNKQPSYFIYIEPHSNCLHPSTNSSFEICSICGPQMRDTTGGLHVVSYTIIPVLFSLIGLYLLCHFKEFVTILNRKKPRLQSAWWSSHDGDEYVLIPSTHIKRTAIWTPPLMAIFFVFVIIQCLLSVLAHSTTGILAPPGWISSEYPAIYSYVAAMKLTIAAVYGAVTVVVYLHLLSRLNHSFNNNPVFRANLPTKCGYHVLIIVIIFYFIYFVSYVMIHAHVFHIHAIQDMVQFYGVLSLGSVDVIMHSLLLYLYCKALYKFKSYFFEYESRVKIDETQLNIGLQSHSEISIEFRRYTVVFVMACVVNIISTILAVTVLIITWMYAEDQVWICIAHILFMILLYCRVMLSFQSIYLSFKTYHVEYKKHCNFCDQWMEKKCNKMVERNTKKTTATEFKTPLEEGVTETVPETVIDDPYHMNINASNEAFNTSNEAVNTSNKAEYNDRDHPDQITIDDYLPTSEHETESHPNIAAMQNAEENIDAIHGKRDEE